MGMLRPALLALVSATVCLACPGLASACLIEGGGVALAGHEPDAPVHTGDRMQWSISKLDDGAAYTVTVGGRVIAKGVKRTGSLGEIRDTFALPDFGPRPRTLPVSVSVTHESENPGHENWDGPIGTPPALNYVPAAAPQTPPPAERPSDPPAVSRPPAQAAVPVPSSSPVGSGPAAGAALPVAHSHGASPAGANRHSARGQAEPVAPSVTAHIAPARRAASAGASRAASTGPGTPAARILSDPRHVRAAVAKVPQAVPDRRTIAAGPPALPGAAPVLRVAPVPRTARADRRPAEVPLAAIAVLLVLTAIAGGGLGWVARRRPPAPSEPPATATKSLEMEAELQEIIAEHRAAEDAAPEPLTRVPG